MMPKRWIVIGLSAGAGLAVVCAAIIAGVLWYASRPARWNTGALMATGGEIEVTMVLRDQVPGQVGRQIESQTGFRVSYTIENTTNRDVTLSPTATLMTRRASDGALDSPRVPIDTPLTLFVPARQRMMFHVHITQACGAEVWTDKTKKSWHECFAYLLGTEAGGLVVVDESQHLQLLLPKPYWSQSGVKVFPDKP